MLLPPKIAQGRYFYHTIPAKKDYPSLSRMTLYFNSGSQNFQIQSLPLNGSEFVFEVLETDSDLWSPGHYSVQADVFFDNKKHFVFESAVEIVPDYSKSGHDPRSHIKKTLDNIEALLEGKATKDVKAFTIAGRSLESMSIEELLKWRNAYKIEYQNEIKEQKIKNGQLGSGDGKRKVYFR